MPLRKTVPDGRTFRVSWIILGGGGTGAQPPRFMLERMEAIMQVSELYRQRAAECERMALKHPNQSDRLKEVAETWRWLADAADDLAETAKTLH
jgi:hypothetical protein